MRKVCRRCNGDKVISIQRKGVEYGTICDFFDGVLIDIPCPDCNGTGRRTAQSNIEFPAVRLVSNDENI